MTVPVSRRNRAIRPKAGPRPPHSGHLWNWPEMGWDAGVRIPKPRPPLQDLFMCSMIDRGCYLDAYLPSRIRGGGWGSKLHFCWSDACSPKIPDAQQLWFTRSCRACGATSQNSRRTLRLAVRDDHRASKHFADVNSRIKGSGGAPSASLACGSVTTLNVTAQTSTAHGSEGPRNFRSRRHSCRHGDTVVLHEFSLGLLLARFFHTVGRSR